MVFVLPQERYDWSDLDNKRNVHLILAVTQLLALNSLSHSWFTSRPRILNDVISSCLRRGIIVWCRANHKAMLYSIPYYEVQLYLTQISSMNPRFDSLIICLVNQLVFIYVGTNCIIHNFHIYFYSMSNFWWRLPHVSVPLKVCRFTLLYWNKLQGYKLPLKFFFQLIVTAYLHKRHSGCWNIYRKAVFLETKC